MTAHPLQIKAHHHIDVYTDINKLKYALKVLFFLVQDRVLEFNCFLTGSCLDVQRMEMFFPSNKTIQAVYIKLPDTEAEIYTKPFLKMINNPIHIKHIYVVSDQEASMTWSNISLLMRHFRIVNTTFPQPSTNQDVYEELMSESIPQELYLYLPSYNDIESESYVGSEFSTDTLQPIPGLETVKSLVLGKVLKVGYTKRLDYLDVFPLVLQTHLWPELCYLMLFIKHMNSSVILVLKETAPKLNYLKLQFDPNNIPDLVWMFDWDSLPWRTGFVISIHYEGESYELDLKNKIKLLTIPPIVISTDVWKWKQRIQIDISYNELYSLKLLMFKLVEQDVSLNFSHNNLGAVNITCLRETPKVLDLSYNHLHDSKGFDLNRINNYFLDYSHLHELYLQHNNFTQLPFTLLSDYANIKSIKDLNELRILDMSHNFITTINSESLIRDDFSPLLWISFKNNSLSSLPNSVYSARYLTHADFSSNRISFRNIWPQTIQLTKRTKKQTSIYLSENSISDLDLSELDQSQINHLHNLLEIYNFHLDGNPINCGCKTHKMYKYFLSFSKSERTNETVEIHPDFSFYETHWKCVTPSQWLGTPLMQIPEYEYDQVCLPTLENCSKECVCYHSWKFNDAIIVNCTHNKTINIPHNVPKDTSHLNLSHNDIRKVCANAPYLKHLIVLDLSWNIINQICPHIYFQLDSLTKLVLTGNKLQNLPKEIEQMKNLEELYLENNQLRDIPKTIQNMTSLETLDISGNMLRCDCDTFWMTGWLINPLYKVKISHNLMCFAGKGRGKHILQLHQDDVGCLSAHRLPASPVLKYSLIIVTSAFLLTIIVATVIYKYRGYIKIWLYARFGFHPWDQVKENLQEKDYDAFVAFCHKDANWVLKTMLPYLEAPQCGFHLCVHDRDFVPGATITKNITTAIKYSRRTILVLTPDFIKSGWCDFEFQAAHKRALDDRSNFLIVVVLKEVDDKDLNETLKFYMKTNTYVSVNDNWFWQKMLYAMPKVPIEKLKAQQNNQDDINKNEGNNRKGRKNRNGRKDRYKRRYRKNRNVEKNRKGVNDSRKGVNDRNDWNEIELGAAGGLEYNESEDVPLLKDGVMGENHDDDDVAILMDVDDEDHDPCNNHPEKRKGNRAGGNYHDHISDVSISDDAFMTNSDEEEFDEDQVYQPPASHSNLNAVARLPPLFKRINSYNDVQ